MLCYLINPKEEIVKTVDYNGDYKKIYNFIDASMFDVVRVYKNRDVIFVDDLGLEKENQFFFMHKNYPTPLAGKGLFMGTDDEGESTGPKTSIDDLRKDVHFIGNKFDLILSIKRFGPENIVDEDYRPMFGLG